MRHGAKADDMLHALNFGLCVARVIMSEPIIQNKVLVERLRNTLGLAHGYSNALQAALSGYTIAGGHQSL